MKDFYGRAWRMNWESQSRYLCTCSQTAAGGTGCGWGGWRILASFELWVLSVRLIFTHCRTFLSWAVHLPKCDSQKSNFSFTRIHHMTSGCCFSLHKQTASLCLCYLGFLYILSANLLQCYPSAVS